MNLSLLLSQAVAWLQLHWPQPMPWSPTLAAALIAVAGWLLARLARPLVGWLGVVAITAGATMVAARLMGVA